MKYAYYPGCTQESTAAEFGHSSQEACRALGIELVEIPDWSCCGASSGHFLDDDLAHALCARNLALAEAQGLDTAIVCAACYLRLRSTQHRAQGSPDFRQKMAGMIDMPYEGTRGVRHLLDIVVNELGLDAVASRVTKPLSGLSLVAYYGCYLVRPPDIVGFDDPENPVSMDRLLESLGARCLDWGAKVDCCGGSLILSKEQMALNLIGGIFERAREVEADGIVVACPMCHANLDMRQKGDSRIPVFYFTELIGLALGLPGAGKWFRKHIVNPAPLLETCGLL